MQSVDELEQWYSIPDPWDYEKSRDDLKRRELLLTEIPQREYEDVLDIGCGNGFITGCLPGRNRIGIDPSENALNHARGKFPDINFVRAGIFDLLGELTGKKFDLIVITGVLYPQYIGKSESLIYSIIEECLRSNGILVSVHISEWYSARFPYPLISSTVYKYREYLHLLEVYSK